MDVTMKFILLTVVTSLLPVSFATAEEKPECPGKSCSWEESSRMFSCENAGCHSFPDITHSNVESIYLGGNNITEFPGDLTFSNLQVLDLNGNGLHSLPKNAFANMISLAILDLSANHLRTLETRELAHLAWLKVLSLQDNVMDVVSTHSFPGMMGLEQLDLSNNQIVFIEEDAFGSFMRLKNLSLSNNRLTALDYQTFDGTIALEKLELNGNSISTLSKENFGNMNKLQILDLSHNRLRDIDPLAFLGLTKLTSLDLGHNDLSVLTDTLDQLALTELNMDYNKFQIIGPSTISLPVQLRNISISHCPQLRRIDDHAFQGLPALNNVEITDNPHLAAISHNAFEIGAEITRLVLRDNGLFSLDPNIVEWSLVEELDLSGNQWHCDCHVAWMKLETMPDRTKTRITCVSPHYLNGMPLADVKMSDLVCSHGMSTKTGLEVGLLVISTVILIAILVMVVMRWRGAFCPCCRGNAAKYAALYNHTEGDNADVKLSPDREQKDMIARNRYTQASKPEVV